MDGRFKKLTPAERTVFHGLAVGRAVKTIAVQTGRSYKAIDSCKYRIMKKLQVKDRLALARLALQWNVATLDEVSVSDELPDVLTDRQREVLTLIGAGVRVRDAARQCGLSYKSTDNHKQRAMYRLNLNDRIHVLYYALKHGLLALDDEDAGESVAA